MIAGTKEVVKYYFVVDGFTQSVIQSNTGFSWFNIHRQTLEQVLYDIVKSLPRFAPHNTVWLYDYNLHEEYEAVVDQVFNLGQGHIYHITALEDFRQSSNGQYPESELFRTRKELELSL